MGEKNQMGGLGNLVQPHLSLGVCLGWELILDHDNEGSIKIVLTFPMAESVKGVLSVISPIPWVAHASEGESFNAEVNNDVIDTHRSRWRLVEYGLADTFVVGEDVQTQRFLLPSKNVRNPHFEHAYATTLQGAAGILSQLQDFLINFAEKKTRWKKTICCR